MPGTPWSLTSHALKGKGWTGAQDGQQGVYWHLTLPETCQVPLLTKANDQGAGQCNGAWPEEKAGSGAKVDWLAFRAREMEHVRICDGVMPQERMRVGPRCTVLF